MAKFLKIRCPECKHEQITFENAAVKVKCKKCNKVLVEPKGGKSLIHAKVVETLA